MPANSRRSVRPHASEESSCLGPGFHSGHSAATHLGEAGVPLPRCATSAPASNPSPRSPNSSNLPVAAADTAPAHGPFWGLPVPPSTRAPRCATSSPAVKRPSQKSPSCSTSPRPRRRLWRAGSATQALGFRIATAGSHVQANDEGQVRRLWRRLVGDQSAPESPYLAFIVGLHVATALALLWFFRADWVRVLAGLGRSVRERRIPDSDARLGWLLVIGTIPVGLTGLVFEHPLRTLFAKPLAAAVFLTINGGILLAGERLGEQRAQRV